MTELAVDLCNRFDQLKSKRSTVQQKWEDVERYVTPYRGDFFKENAEETSIEWERYGYDYASVPVVSHQKIGGLCGHSQAARRPL